MSTSSQILLGSLTGDALALGAHWIYSQDEIRQKLGRITGYADPATSYHTGKRAGDFTHYGDQTMVLLRSLARHGGFDLGEFAADWRAYWETPGVTSYRDGATKATLLQLQQGGAPLKSASSSNDLAGAGRIGPLFLLKWGTEAEFLKAVRAQTAFTHGDPVVAETAEFFARVCLAVKAGAPIAVALAETGALPHWKAVSASWLNAAMASSASGATDAAALSEHGLTCHVPDAFPAVCHLLLRHPDNGGDALKANVEAGGDSAARGMILGLVYGARGAAGGIPAEWTSELRAFEEVDALMKQVTQTA